MQNYFDYFYAILYVILLFLSYRAGLHNDKRTTWIAIAVTFFFIAFRAPVVGADTYNYVRYLTGEHYFYNLDPRPLEIFFVYYREFINQITDSRFVVMLINTTITMAPVFYMVKKYSYNAPLSLLMFFYLDCTAIYFVGLRQIIGFSFILWGLLYCINEMEPRESSTKYPSYKALLFLGISILIGYFFHTSIIVYGAIIVLALFTPLKSKTVASSLICGSAVIGFILGRFDVLGFFNFLYLLDVDSTARLSGYLLNEELHQVSAINIVARLSVLGLVSLYFIDTEKMNHVFFKLFVFGITIYNLLYSVPMIHRFVPIFNLFGTIVFTWILYKRRRGQENKYQWAKIVCILVVLYYTRSMFIRINEWDPNSEDRMHPYYFIFQDYSNHPSIKKF